MSTKDANIRGGEEFLLTGRLKGYPYFLKSCFDVLNIRQPYINKCHLVTEQVTS